MPDPVLNEQLILEILQEPFGPSSAERLATAAFLAIADARDRKIEREAFIELLNSATQLNSACVQSLLLTNILHKKANNTFHDDQVVEGLKKINMLGETHREALFKQADLVAQCPMEADTQH